MTGPAHVRAQKPVRVNREEPPGDLKEYREQVSIRRFSDLSDAAVGDCARLCFYALTVPIRARE